MHIINRCGGDVLTQIKERWTQAGRFSKRGFIYVAISLAGLLYELIWDDPVKWFAVIIWLIILGLGIYLLLFMKDAPR